MPGALAGWDLLVRTHGARTLSAALQPAIGYARDGFPVTPIIAGQWADETALLQDDPAAAATFLPGGRLQRPGNRFRNPDYAGILETIAKSGIGAFYGGEIGQRIVARLAELDGFITLDDLRANAPNWVSAISTTFRGYRVWELPPSNQGIAVLEMLRILEPYDLKSMGHNSAPYLHHLIEAKKLAYADLGRFVGDADHLDAPAEHLLSDAFIAQRRGLHRSRQGTGTGRTGTAAHRERDGLSQHGRCRGKHGVADQLELQSVWLGHRGSGHRLRAAQSRSGLYPHAGHAQHRRSRKAAVSHPDSRVCDPRRRIAGGTRT